MVPRRSDHRTAQADSSYLEWIATLAEAESKDVRPRRRPPRSIPRKPGLKCRRGGATMFSAAVRPSPNCGKMRILLTDPTSAGDLLNYLRRCGCSAEIAGYGSVEAAPEQRRFID